MKERILKLIRKNNSIVDKVVEADVNDKLKSVKYDLVVDYIELVKDKNFIKNYIDDVVSKFFIFCNDNKTELNGTLFNYSNKTLLKDIEQNGLFISNKDGQIIGINVLIKYRNVKAVTNLDFETSEELLSIADSSDSDEEAESLMTDNLRAKILDQTKISQIKPEKIIIQLISVI